MTIGNAWQNFPFFFRVFPHGLVFLLMDICCTEIRILFSQQPVRYQGAMNECQDKRVERLEQAIGGSTKMVGWKVGEGGQCRLVKEK